MPYGELNETSIIIILTICYAHEKLTKLIDYIGIATLSCRTVLTLINRSLRYSRADVAMLQNFLIIAGKRGIVSLEDIINMHE